MGKAKKNVKKTAERKPVKLPTKVVRIKNAETYRNMSEFIELAVQQLGDAGVELSKRDVKTAIEVFNNIITEQLSADDEHKAKTPFGVTLLAVPVPKKPARDGRNPATGETIRLPPRPATVKLKARIQKALKTRILE